MTTFSGPREARHENADTSPVTVERSDAIDAAGALLVLAANCRRQAKSRSNAGDFHKASRAHLRSAADVYEAAAKRMQDAADNVSTFANANARELAREMDGRDPNGYPAGMTVQEG